MKMPRTALDELNVHVFHGNNLKKIMNNWQKKTLKK